jgi:hypothetical protein
MNYRKAVVAALAALAYAPSCSAFSVVWPSFCVTALACPPPHRARPCPHSSRTATPRLTPRSGSRLPPRERRGRQTERGLLLDGRLIARACRASPATPRTRAQGPALPQMRSLNLLRAAPLRMSAAEPVAAGAKVTFTQEMRNKAMSLHTFSQVSTRRGP